MSISLVAIVLRGPGLFLPDIHGLRRGGAVRPNFHLAGPPSSSSEREYSYLTSTA
jgi:hypothetical protein